MTRRDDRDDASETGLSHPDLQATRAEGGSLPSADPFDDQLRRWDRYQVEELVGEGGMGRVYRAFDPQLRRHVALKFLSGTDPTLAQRFLNEAQAQARVDHDHVCKVFEVGDVGGRLYIAMQYVAGPTLKEAADELETDVIVRVVRQVCEGIHAAHRLGLIHRDVKPGNVLLERHDDGEIHPYITDFGLAREAGRPGMTRTGFALGTPEYMAPEQITGPTTELDVRTDVYGLGATLYRSLSGRHPFAGASDHDVIRRVLDDEVTGLRKIRPETPRDLDTIVAKCLEKDPARRYDSARALGEDLQRYSNGEPVEAQAPTLTYRLTKAIRRNRALATTVAVATVAVLVTAGVAVRSWWTADRQAEIARDLGREVERMEWMTRAAYQLPLHDTRPDVERIKLRIEALEALPAEAGRLAAGPARYAIGRGLLTLDDLDGALANLREAWDSGYRDPVVAGALASVHGALYRRALIRAEAIGNATIRSELRTAAQRELREPALAYLGDSTDSAAEPTGLAGAQIAFYDERWDDAIELAQAALDGAPWLYEAAILQGDVHLEVAAAARAAGDVGAANTAWVLADQAFARAIEVGRSDPDALLRSCQLARARLHASIWGRDATPSTDRYREATAACDRAETADPDRTEMLVQRADLLATWAEGLAKSGEDPSPTLAEALDVAEGSIERDADHTAAYVVLAEIHSQRAERANRVGEDPREALAASNRALDRVIELEPNRRYAHHLAALNHVEQSKFERRRSIDPSASFEQAMGYLENALAIDPENVDSIGAFGTTSYFRSRFIEEQGGDPRPDLATAITQFERILEVDPEAGWVYSNITGVSTQMGIWEIDHGHDPTESIETAVRAANRAHELYPEDSFAYFNEGHGHYRLGTFEAMQGRDPTSHFERSQAAFARGLELNDSLAGPHSKLALLDTAWAAWDLESGIDPAVRVAAARTSAASALERAPDHVGAYRARAEAGWVAAAWAIQQGRAPMSEFDQARAALDAALEISPSDGPALLAMAELARRRAAWELTAGRDATPTLERGLRGARQVIEAQPGLGEAHALEGALLHLTADAAPAGKAESIRDEARTATARGLELNPNLERRFSRPG